MKHIEIVKRWLDGETVQVLTPHADWVDLKPQEEFKGFNNLFSDCFEYRIKPEVKYKYQNVYAGRASVTGSPHSSLFDANKNASKFHQRTHILKVGDDGSAELIACQDDI